MNCENRSAENVTKRNIKIFTKMYCFSLLISVYCNTGCANGWIADKYCDQVNLLDPYCTLIHVFYT